MALATGLRGNTKLEVLDLRNNNISNEGEHSSLPISSSFKLSTLMCVTGVEAFSTLLGRVEVGCDGEVGSVNVTLQSIILGGNPVMGAPSRTRQTQDAPVALDLDSMSSDGSLDDESDLAEEARGAEEARVRKAEEAKSLKLASMRAMSKLHDVLSLGARKERLEHSEALRCALEVGSTTLHTSIFYYLALLLSNSLHSARPRLKGNGKQLQTPKKLELSEKRNGGENGQFCIVRNRMSRLNRNRCGYGISAPTTGDFGENDCFYSWRSWRPRCLY